jgi:hypothetical protein
MAGYEGPAARSLVDQQKLPALLDEIEVQDALRQAPDSCGDLH